MLKFFRKHARGWFMIAIIAIIIVVFVLYFGSSRGGRNANAIAVIDKRVISEAEFHNEYERLLDMARQTLKDKLTPEMLKKMDLKKKAYDSLIDREVILAKAADMNVQISDQELRNIIMSMPALQTNGVFDERKYSQLLRYNRLNAEDFESMYKTDLISSKIAMFVREGVKVSGQEIRDYYDLQNRKINVSFVQISGNDVRKNIAPSQSELEDYLKHNGNQFRVAEQLKVRYMVFNGASAPASVSDDDIRSYYENYKEKFKSKSGKQLQLAEARGAIVKELQQNRGKQSASAEARKARDVIYQDENMEAYGRKNNMKVYSTDFFAVNKPPKDFASVKNLSDALPDMQKGEISKVLTGDDGYYLIQVVDKKAAYVPKLDAIEKEVRQKFIESQKQALAGKEAQSVADRIKTGEALDKIAKEEGLKVMDTGFFQIGANIPKIGESTDAAEMLMQLSTNKPCAEKPLLIHNTYYIFKLKDVTRPDEKSFEEQKAGYARMLLSIKQGEAMRTWLEGNKTAMIKDRRIKIKKNVEDL
jgi:peptidyl-prolyl cis-trans isomerase D